MFAFAIWDKNIQTLFLARDRIGKKPLKYYLDDQGILFASELKAILTDPRVNVQTDYQAIDWYLTHQYVPTPKTGFTRIHKLPQAHYLVCQNRQVTIKKYWDLHYQPDYSISDNDWHEKILASLDEATRLRLIADVPIGAFLSGGTDSSAIVSSMAKQSPKPVKTFSIGFADQKYNELPYAKIVAQKYQTDHTELIIEPEDIKKTIEKLVYHFEEPYADASALPTYYISEITRQYVTVALNGDGGDENFAGYPWYKVGHWFHKLDGLSPFIAFGQPIGDWLYTHNPSNLTRLSSVFLASLGYPLITRHPLWIAYFSDFEKDRLYTNDMQKYRTNSPVLMLVKQAHATHPIDNALYTDIMTYLTDDLVVKVDIASMACSLETRSPLLDHQLLELTASIPVEKKIKGRYGKMIFKKALERRLPKEILYRKKQGFSIPIDRWFREDLKTWGQEILFNKISVARQLFGQEFLTQLFDQHVSGRIDHGRRLWALIMLELWFRQFMDRKPSN
jgi:asparagine synthase (glutamine-hydrolysing)